MKNSRALLLDVDGVLLHQPRVMTRISYKVCSFVHKTVPRVNNLMQAMDVNTMLYTSFGHTHIGLQKLYGKSAPSLKEFNAYVYDDEILHYLSIHQNDEIFKRRAKQVQLLLTKASQYGIPCYIFSNAPDVWCDQVIDMLCAGAFIPEANRLSSSHPVFEENLLKPDAKLYKNVATYIQQTHHDKDMEIMFVDDSLINLIPILHNSTWIPIHLKQISCQIQPEHVHIAHEMDDITNMI